MLTLGLIGASKDLSKGISQTEIRPGLCCKGLGYETAKHIVEKAPFSNLEDLAQKTDSKYVTAEAVAALIDAGFFKGREGQKRKDELVITFGKIRKGLKKSQAKGIKSADMFQ